MQLMPNDREASSKRTLATLKTNLEDFRAAGNDIKYAKLFNNVIDDVMFNVELDQVIF